MRTIHANFEAIKYPVGDKILYNIPIIKNMGDKIKTILIKTKLDYFFPINLICSGSSGAIIAAMIATILNEDPSFTKIYIRHIKKESENSHGYSYMSADWFVYWLDYSILLSNHFMLLYDRLVCSMMMCVLLFVVFVECV